MNTGISDVDNQISFRVQHLKRTIICLSFHACLYCDQRCMSSSVCRWLISMKYLIDQANRR